MAFAKTFENHFFALDAGADDAHLTEEQKEWLTLSKKLVYSKKTDLNPRSALAYIWALKNRTTSTLRSCGLGGTLLEHSLLSILPHGSRDQPKVIGLTHLLGQMDHTQVIDALKNLISAGVVTKSERGLYRATAQGVRISQKIDDHFFSGLEIEKRFLWRDLSMNMLGTAMPEKGHALLREKMAETPQPSSRIMANDYVPAS